MACIAYNNYARNLAVNLIYKCYFAVSWIWILIKLFYKNCVTIDSKYVSMTTQYLTTVTESSLAFLAKLPQQNISDNRKFC